MASTEGTTLDVLMAWRSDIISNFASRFDALSEKVTGMNFNVNLDTGELEYTGDSYIFNVNETTGNLEWEAI